MEDEWVRDPDAEEDLDVLYVTYDSARITIDELKAAIAAHDFEAEVKQE